MNANCYRVHTSISIISRHLLSCYKSLFLHSNNNIAPLILKKENMKKEKLVKTQNTLTSIYILFLIWPFTAFLASLKYIKNKWFSRVIFMAFFAVVGYSLNFDPNSGTDSLAYANQFADVVKYNETITLAGRLEYGALDIYTDIIFRLAAMFTDSPKMLFAFFGAIYGFFVRESIALLYKFSDKRNLMSVIILLVILFFLNPHSNINGVRFWTATWAWFYAFLLCENERNWKGWLVMVGTVFMHTTFLIPLVLYALSKIFISRHSLTIMFIIYLFTFALSFFLKGSEFIQYFNFFSQSDHYSIYITADALEKKVGNQENLSFVSQIFNYLSRLFVCYYISRFYLRVVKDGKNSEIFSTFAFVLCFGVFANLTISIPSLGGRFAIILYMLIIILIISEYKLMPQKRSVKFALLVFICLFGVIYQNFLISLIVLTNKYITPTLLWI